MTFWSLLAAGVVAFFVWLVYVPYRPEKVFETIPASAAWVSVHPRLADEWPALIRNPALTNLLIAAGVKPEDTGKLGADPVLQAWIRKLAGRETVIAYVPVMGYQNQPAWVFATWIGSQSITLRLRLPFIRSSGLRRVPVENGRTVYIARTAFAQPGQKLSLALMDGVLVGCLSADPVGVRWLLETGDRYPWKPSLRTSGQLDRARGLLAATPPPHWGWFSLPTAGDAGMVAYTLELGSDRRLEARMVTATPVPGAAMPLSAPALASMTDLLGESPDLIAVLPLASVAPLALRSETPLWTATARALLSPANLPSNALAVVAVLDQAHCSRIRGPLGPVLGPLMKGLKLPTLVLGYEVGSSDEADARIDQALDQLNVRYSTGLIRHTVPAGSRTITLIEETRSGFYSKFEPDERVAYVVCDGWLFLCSNATVLKKRLADHEARGDQPAPPAPWFAAALRTPATAAAWMDLTAGAKTVKDLAGAAQLITLMVNTKDSSKLRETLTGWRKAADLLKPFETAEATLSCSNGLTHLNVVLGATR